MRERERERGNKLRENERISVGGGQEEIKEEMYKNFTCENGAKVVHVCVVLL
jgi:hypothetical protein